MERAVVNSKDLEAYCVAVLRHEGVEASVAAEVAHHLVEANILGHDSHGVGMLPQYCTNVARGMCRKEGSAAVVQQKGAVLVMDAGRLFGQVALRQAVERAAAVAKTHGVCSLTLRKAHHVGRVGAYAELAASLGLVSIFFANINDHAPLVAPFGGSDARGSTNPIAMGVPRSGSNVVLDFATSVWPLGKARVAFNRFESLPAGVAIDAQGKPSTDPEVLFPGVSRGGAYTLGMKDKSKMGCLAAFGRHKGAGLNLFCEIFGALAGGGTSAADSPSNPADARDNGTINNVFCVLIDPSALSAENWNAEVETMCNWWVGSPPAPNASPVLLPGDAERRSAAVRLNEGIPLEASTWEALLKLAGGAIPPPPCSMKPAAQSAKRTCDGPPEEKKAPVSSASFPFALVASAVAIFAAGVAIGRRTR